MRNTWLSYSLLLFLIGCTELEVSNNELPHVVDPVPERSDPGETAEESSVVAKAVVVDASCIDNSDCEAGESCVEGSCKILTSLYVTDCQEKCMLRGATLETSDGNIIHLRRGEGTYAYAGALQYEIGSIPAYCPQEELEVPLEIKKVTTGKVLNTQVLTLQEGETSEVITHLTVKRVQFRLTLKEIEEEC